MYIPSYLVVMDGYYMFDNIHDIEIIHFHYRLFVVLHFRYIYHYILFWYSLDIGIVMRNEHGVRQFGAWFVEGGYVVVLHVLRDCSYDMIIITNVSEGCAFVCKRINNENGKSALLDTTISSCIHLLNIPKFSILTPTHT